MPVQRIQTMLFALCFLLIFVGGAFLGFEKIALDSAAYDRIQAEIGHYDYIGLTPDAQSRVNRVLSDYLAGRRQDVEIEETLLGSVRQVFNEDEKAHMTDVLNLFRLERSVRTACLAAGVILLALSVLLAPGDSAKRALAGLKASFIALLAAVTALALLYAFSGFDRLFILFHQLLFTNDLWLMDPRTDAMIRMFPSEFFGTIAAQCGLSALVSGCASTAAAWSLASVAGLLINHPRRKQTP